MAIAILCLLLALNFAISWWNAHVCGQVWTESKAIGGWIRLVTWCAAIMSAIGFTFVYLIVGSLIGGAMGWLSPEQVKAIVSLGYVVIIIPLLGTGAIIWIHSLIEAYKRRDMLSVGVAAWNTYAQVSNMYDAARTLPNLLEYLGGLLKSDNDSDGKALLFKIAVVAAILALLSGTLTTASIIRRTARKYAKISYDSLQEKAA